MKGLFKNGIIHSCIKTQHKVFHVSVLLSFIQSKLNKVFKVKYLT